MKIVIISTWPPRACGIATYSYDLVSALKEKFPRAEIHVVCHTDGTKKLAGVHIHPLIDMTKYDWFVRAFEEIKKISPDIVHIQHEFGIYTLKIPGTSFNFMPDEAIAAADLVYKLNTAKIPTTITYHSVYSLMTYEEVLYYNTISYLCDATIVHECYQKEKFCRYFNFKPLNIFNIPHGSWPINPYLDKQVSKGARGWQDKLVVGMYGFFEPNKDFSRLIKLWPQIKRQVPQAHLVIEGEARHGSPTGESEKAKITNMAKDPRYNLDNSIELIIKFFNDRENARILVGFDAAVFPYKFASQSGNLAHAYSVGLPVVTSDIEGLASSVKSSRAGYIAQIDDDFVIYISQLLKKEKLRRKFALNSLKYSHNVNNWYRVATSHMRVYKKAIHYNKTRRKTKKYLPNRIHV